MSMLTPQMRFKQAQPDMFHSPKIEDRVENHVFSSWSPILGLKKQCRLLN